MEIILISIVLLLLGALIMFLDSRFALLFKISLKCKVTGRMCVPSDLENEAKQMANKLSLSDETGITTVSKRELKDLNARLDDFLSENIPCYRHEKRRILFGSYGANDCSHCFCKTSCPIMRD